MIFHCSSYYLYLPCHYYEALGSLFMPAFIQQRAVLAGTHTYGTMATERTQQDT